MIADQLSDADKLARIEAALLRMPRYRREIYFAVRLDDMPYTDIAAYRTEQPAGRTADGVGTAGNRGCD